MIFFIFLLKTWAVVKSTHNLCFGAKIRKLGIPLHTCTPGLLRSVWKRCYKTFFKLSSDKHEIQLLINADLVKINGKFRFKPNKKKLVIYPIYKC